MFCLERQNRSTLSLCRFYLSIQIKSKDMENNSRKKPENHHCHVVSLLVRRVSTIYLKQLNMYLYVSTKNTQNLCRQAGVPNFVLVGSKKLSAALHYHTIPSYTISYYTIPYYTIPYHIIPYHTIPYHIIPYYIR